MSTDPRELARLRTFYLAQPGSGDLRAAFAIDGRDYTTPGQVRADVHAAVAELHAHRLPARFVTRPVTADSPRPEVPSWPAWHAHHTGTPPPPQTA